MSKLIALSWTRLDAFEQCPRKFQGQYVTKDFPKGDYSGPAIMQGRAVHDTIETRLKDGTPIPYPIIYEGVEYDVDIRWMEEKILFACTKYPNVLVEHSVTLGAKFEQLTWFSKQAWWRATFDLLVIIGDTAIIIDWKTGKVRGKSDQLKLFAAIAFKSFPAIKRVLTAYVWCEHPNSKPSLMEYTKDQEQDLWDEFGERAELVQIANESGNWPAKKNMYCRWCDALPNQCEYKGAD